MLALSQTEKFKALGTDICLWIVFEKEEERKRAKADLLAAKDLYFRYQKTFSRFDKDSELCRLNSRLGVFQPASAELLRIAGQSLVYYKLTSGFFDPRIIGDLENIGYRKDFQSTDFGAVRIEKIDTGPKGDLDAELKIKDGKIFLGSKIDLSGIAKGCVTDQVFDFLKERGWKNILVDSGGDMKASGKNPDGEDWKIVLEGFSGEGFSVVLSDDYPAIATSGISRRKWEIGGQRYHHLINPKKPDQFRFDLRSVTVTAKTCESADVWAKVLYIMGIKEGVEYCEKHKLRSVFLDARGNITLSSGLK